MRGTAQAVVVGLALFATLPTLAQDSTAVVTRPMLGLGDPIPAAGLAVATVGGASRALADVAGPAGLVVMFWSNTCPWSDRYASRVAALAEAYRPAGFGFALVNANGRSGLEGDGAEASRAELEASALTVPYLLDADGALSEAFGARNAPHAFLFGPDRTLLYDGAIDDSPSSAERAERLYLREAMDRSVAGLPVEVQRTQAFGCLSRTVPQ